MDAALSCSLLCAWCLWSLLSEILLAATHIKVLFCFGKPIPAKELSTKRWTYFLYDLLSPWLALAPVAAVAAAAAAAISQTPAAGADPATVSSTAAWPLLEGAAALPVQPHLLLETLNITGTPTVQQSLLLVGNSSDLTRFSYQLTDGNCSTPWECSQEASVSQRQHVLLPLVAAAASTGLLAAASTPANAAMLLLLLGHAALHMYYIATWSSSRHSRNVIEMSAVSSGSSRWQRFRAWEVLWFWVGTSYDITTHVVVSSLLLRAASAASRGVLLWQQLDGASVCKGRVCVRH